MDLPKPRISRNPRSVKPFVKGDQYVYSKIKYRYERVSWDVFMSNKYDTYQTVRSSFIPYTIINNERYWVLGSYHDFPRDILTDFGGSCIIFDPPGNYLNRGEIQKRNYQHPFGCAMLELNEESKGLLVKPVLRVLSGNDVIIYRGSDNKNKEYVWFIVTPLNYETVKPVIDNFETTPYISNESLGPIEIYKETDILSKKHRTSRNLTDFIDYLTNSQ